MILTAIDPGKHASAVAEFHDGTLRRVFYGRMITYFWAPEVAVVVELPQVYTRGSSKGDPNDLVDLAFSAGRLVGNATNLRTVRPREWKGQLPKNVHHARVRKALSAAELAVLDACNVPVSKRHNVLDAVGLGLWALRRAV